VLRRSLRSHFCAKRAQGKLPLPAALNGRGEHELAQIFKWLFRDKYSGLEKYRKDNPIKLPAITSSLRKFIERNKDNGFYQVTMYNDDATPMEFVMEVLEFYLSYSVVDATEKMSKVHRLGAHGIYASNEEAAYIVSTLINDVAKSRGYPLKCSVQNI
ncbi:ATP-dependent Clp protease adaptor ClpS, partial [uncultured Microbulbifer sp.]|uniref:ATP-dependent Clp protease adaptor ClpS n=1 Tax=uncultured Microbulbifer sp. TaxID=348147 RepID=UPI00260AF250